MQDVGDTTHTLVSRPQYTTSHDTAMKVIKGFMSLAHELL